jgi:UDP-galactopyranose mutase
MSYDIVCFSHLRWNFVYQRPQHLMSGLAVRHRVFFIEEPIFDNEVPRACLQVEPAPESGVYVVTPHLNIGSTEQQIADDQAALLAELLVEYNINNYISWYYSPMALSFTERLHPIYTVYDCMDELSAFMFAPPALKQYEAELLKKSDIVFTGGNSLYLAKMGSHDNIYSFPSSIDKEHFGMARKIMADPPDQSVIPYPRIGFYGVIDERLNIALLDEVSDLKPEWQFVLIGPVVKIDPSCLPQRSNIHWLGAKDYSALPAYLSGWDIAMMPFALNASTRFISPTKTPEYLAGGKPVISPSIADVVSPYGDLGLVHIADTAGEFVGIAAEFLRHGTPAGWLSKVDRFLSARSWVKSVTDMEMLIDNGIGKTTDPQHSQNKLHV